MNQMLSRTQKKAFEEIKSAFKVTNLIMLRGFPGSGKTTVIKELQKDMGGRMITMKDIIERHNQNNPFSLEESTYNLLLESVKENDIVFVDDIDLISDVSKGFGYLKGNFIHIPFNALMAYINDTGKKMLFTITKGVPYELQSRCHYISIEKFKLEDQKELFTYYLGKELAKNIDFDEVYRFAPKLNAHQIRISSETLKLEKVINTESLLSYLKHHKLNSNVNLSKVEKIDFTYLKGIDNVLKSLETNLLMPLSKNEVARKYKLKPKKGIVLYGPPGTGKTTIGKVLAHKLEGKFFMIDGSFIPGGPNYYDMIRDVFFAAKINAPSVIFIDDSDVLFNSISYRTDMGFYRYLLTELDGIESDTDETICIILTAMEVNKLPPALVRSGRIELWLEVKPPDENARKEIFLYHLNKVEIPCEKININELVKLTKGFTGADIKRTIQDALNLLAYDELNNSLKENIMDYFTDVIKKVSENRKTFEEKKIGIRPGDNE